MVGADNGTRTGPVLSQTRATALMVGAGVGAGAMAVPYLADRTGFAGLLGIVGVAYGVNCLIHLMLAEVIFRTGRDLQVIELMRVHLFRGRWAPVVWFAFGLLALAFVAILAAYVAGSSAIVVDMLGIDPLAADLVVYVAAALVVLFGLRAVGTFEHVGVAVLIAVVLVLAVGAIGTPFSLAWHPSGDASAALALYALVMYALYTFYTVPQVVQGLAPDHRAAVRAIVWGLGLNALLVLTVAFIAMGVSHPVTEVASVGIAEAIGGWAGTVGSVFVLVALLTSFWSVSLALADVISQRLPIGRRPGWLLATLPSLLLLYLGGLRFVELLQLAGGATGLVVVLVTVPMYVRARRSNPGPVAWQMTRWGVVPALALVVVAASLMALGSLIDV